MLPPPASLRCRIGWHTPLPGPTWNEGYYFSRCRRCGIDLVRTTFSGWETPRGYRVIWRATPPDAAQTPTARIGRTPKPVAELPAKERRPLQFHKPSSVPDFMSDPNPPTPRDIDASRSRSELRRLPPR